ncbi:hypothetical protein GOODEAATRI_034111 [Goodea atripinnis]|uniref:Uncharacterized protein n=1 Tax=Goodea atripinnis TaxID=208336 RepID=A0ABV0PJB2_9TELE
MVKLIVNVTGNNSQTQTFRLFWRIPFLIFLPSEYFLDDFSDTDALKELFYHVGDAARVCVSADTSRTEACLFSGQLTAVKGE